jgi:very-short-patch-repair endonuclease
MFKKVHGDKYDYSKVIYTKMHDKVPIICPKHGEFLQTPSKHLKGQGCRLCGIEERAKKKTKTTEQFIKEAKSIHGDKYDYSKTVYTHAFEKVCIICPTHGEFWQRAFDHIHKHGCPQCSESSLERGIKVFLDENKIDYEKQKRFDWLDKQSLDFYLPQYNIAIECQGEQHFEPVEHFGGEKEFEITKERDIRKKNLCSEHGIKILYFSNLKHKGCITNKDELLKQILND